MKNKFISLVCALSMIVTMFASFTIVNAADEPTIAGTATKKGDTVTLTVDYSGLTKVSVAQFTATLPTDAFEALEKDENDEFPAVVADEAFSSATINYTEDGKLIFIWAASKKAEYAAGEGNLATVTLKVKAGAEVPDKIELSSVIFQDEPESGTTTYGTEDQKPANSMTVKNATIIDPDAPAPAKDRPTTNDDPKPEVPTVVSGPQINADAELGKDGKTVTLKVSYKELTKVSVAQFTAVLPTTVFEALEKDENDEFPAVVAAEAFSSATVNYTEDGKLIFIWAASKKAEYAAGEGDLATVTLTLKEGVTLPQTIELASIIFQDEPESGTTTYGTEDQKPANAIGVVNAVVKAPAKTFTKSDIALSEAAGKVTATGDDDTSDGTTPYYVVVTATKNNGNDTAVYGDDYVAYYDDIELTEGQLNNYLAGKYGTIADALNHITFAANNGVVISAELDKDGSKYPISSGSVSVGNAPATPRPTTPKIGVTVSPATVYVGTKTTVTAKITDPKDDGVLTVVATEDSLDYVTGSGIKSEVADDNKSATTTFTPALKGTNAIVLNYTYTYTDENDEVQTVTAEKKITIKEKTTENGGGSSSSSTTTTGGTGIIAGPNAGATTGANPYGVSFNDLGDVEWAQTAIFTLAAKGIINGRDEYTFDPNANITRAEYCQILVGAIDKSSEYADASFTDVSTDAWFYHAVAVASKYGIVEGYGDGNFGPYDLITRQDMALMTYKAAQVMNKDLASNSSQSFTDADQIAEYAQNAVYSLANAGIISGMGDGTFAPVANATRAQAAVIIYSTFEK